jgi:hypothetical protein
LALIGGRIANNPGDRTPDWSAHTSNVVLPQTAQRTQKVKHHDRLFIAFLIGLPEISLSVKFTAQLLPSDRFLSSYW